MKPYQLIQTLFGRAQTLRHDVTWVDLFF